MTRQEAIRNLLQSQEFLDVIQELRDNQMNSIRYSESHQKEERERKNSCLKLKGKEHQKILLRLWRL